MVNLAALTLAIWTMIALAIRRILTDTLINLNTEPCKGFGDIFFGSWHKACGVGILNTEKHIAAMLASEKVVKQGSTHTANMQRASWTRRKTNTNFSIHIVL